MPIENASNDLKRGYTIAFSIKDPENQIVSAISMEIISIQDAVITT